MKKLILTLLLIIFFSKPSLSQIPSDYPFKTLIDENNFLFITGDSLDNVWTKKVNLIGGREWINTFPNPGFDRGMDIAVLNQEEGNIVFATGYIKEQNTDFNDIIVIKYDYSNGDILWHKIYGQQFYDDKAYGISIDENGNAYIAGYSEVKYKGKNFVILKYESDGPSGSLVWKYQYNNRNFNGDEVATDILIDRYHLYACGYTYNGVYGNDIILGTFSLQDIQNNLTDTAYIPDKYQSRYNQTPTGFILNSVSFRPQSKSRAVISGFSDNSGYGSTEDYFTIYFDCNFSDPVRWFRRFDCSGGTDIATSVASDRFNNIYVTGYSFRNSTKSYDFATMKYNYINGSYGWDEHIKYFDYNNQGGTDKASSVKTRYDSVYIAGQSTASGIGFTIKKYAQSNGGIENTWEQDFEPAFAETLEPPGQMNSGCYLELDSLGNVYLITFAWNSSVKYYAIRKYDANGNVIYTIDNYPEQDNQEDNNNHSSRNSELSYELKQNYPNPFNPSTKISYSIPKEGTVTLKIYDLIGQEVKTLVSEMKQAGSHEAEFNAGSLASGIYFYRLQSGDYTETRQMTLIK